MATIAIISLLVLVTLTLLSLVTIAVIRAVRRLQKRRYAPRTAAPRRLLLALAASGEETDLAELVRMPRPHWRAIETTAFQMLGKVRGHAHDALAEVFHRRGLSNRARRNLRRPGGCRRARAAYALGSLHDTAAVPDLSRLLSDRRTDVRVAAVQALGRIGDARATRPLIDSLSSARPTPSLLVAQALCQIGRPAVPDLIAALRHDDALVRLTALDALRLLGAADAGAQVAQLLDDDPSPQVREAAATTLGRIGTYTALRPLLAAASPLEPAPLRAAAAHALGELGIAAAAQPLVALLPSGDHQVSRAAATALLRAGPEGAAALATIATGTDNASAYAREALALAELDRQRRAASRQPARPAPIAAGR